MSNKLTLVVVMLFSLQVPVLSIADHDGTNGHDHQSKPRVDRLIPASEVSVAAGETVIIVHGIVCSFCSQGVRRKLSKLSFIDHSKYTKGVKVEIEQQKVTIANKPGVDFDLKQVFKAITSGGYEPIEAYVRDVDGKVSVHKPE
ncbi:MAG: hypothetical protein ACI9SC_001502 [Gammaproteobacteria bacterium]|jgi:hypothetical protein